MPPEWRVKYIGAIEQRWHGTNYKRLVVLSSFAPSNGATPTFFDSSSCYSFSCSLPCPCHSAPWAVAHFLACQLLVAV